MEYQLVLQFEADTLDAFDRLVAYEEALIGELRGIAKVDGHDFGCSEFNIFVLTARTAETFQKAHQLYTEQHLRYPLRAAYRDLTADSFVVLWPSTLTEFTVS